MKNKLQIVEVAASLAIKSPSITIGIGATMLGVWTTYQYAPSILYGIAALGSVSFGNHKLSNLAVDQGNSGLYDYTATISELLNKVSFGYFSKVDPDQVLAAGIDHANPEIVKSAIGHGADINREIEGTRPLERALDLDNGEGNVIALHLIQGGADLTKSTGVANTGNLFHKVVHSGKKELAETAIAQAVTNHALTESVDENGNNIAHIQAASPNIREAVQDAGIVLTPNAINTANKEGQTPVDVVMHSYSHGGVSPEFVTEYLDKGSAHATQQYFGQVMGNPNLRQHATIIAGKDGFNAALQDRTGLLPIDHVLKYGTDEVAVEIAGITNPALFTNQHLWAAYQRPGLETTRDTLAGHLLTSPAATQSFFHNPTGDGESLASKMILGSVPFDTAIFQQIYNVEKDLLKGMSDPLELRTELKLNWLHSAAIAGNRDAVEAMRDIIVKEGVMSHISALASGTGTCLTSLCHHGFSRDLGTLAETEKAFLVMFPGLTKQYLSLPAPQTDAEGAEGGVLMSVGGGGAAAPVLSLDDFKEGRLVVRKGYARQEEEFLAKIQELRELEERRAIEREERLREAHEEEKDNGLTEEVRLAPMERYAVRINQKAVITGGLIKQVTMSKGLVTSVTGSDALEGNIPFWTTTFGIGGYLEAYGKGHAHPGNEALIGAAVYGVTSYMMDRDMTALPGYTAPEERGIGDFLYKYGDYIATSPIINFMFLGASAYTGGYIGGTTGILKSLGTATAISTTVSYNMYTTDPKAEPQEASYSDYLTIENTFAAAVTGYVAYGAAVAGIASVSAVAATASAPVVIAAATTSTLYAISKAHSAWAIAKLASSTVSPAISPLKEIGYDIASSAIDTDSEYTAEGIYNIAFSAIDTASKYVTELKNIFWQDKTEDIYGFTNAKCYYNNSTEMFEGEECMWNNMCPANLDV